MTKGHVTVDIFFDRAVRNIIAFGDTDIFPFPIENRIIFDLPEKFKNALADLDKDFDRSIYDYPPAKVNAIVPVGYTGFRWAAQIDPLWNAYLLALTLSLAEEIEKQRVPVSDNVVHSYRYHWDDASAEIFSRDFSWRTFQSTSRRLAEEARFVVACDISEFYGRINHHRLENALQHLNGSSGQSAKIMKILGVFSDTYSVGIPVGGPASRILSELVLNQVDRLLIFSGVRFCRYSDDYHLFAESYEEAFKALTFLSQKLLQTQVLQLQKTKTRIMTREEFLSTTLKSAADVPETESVSIIEQSQRLMWFSIKFDPYSANPQEDYARLRFELEKFDVLEILRSELQKSRVHIPLTRKLIQAMRFLSEDARDGAAISMFSNIDLLYPVLSSVLITTYEIFDELGQDAANMVLKSLSDLIDNQSYVMEIEVHLSFALRVISKRKTADFERMLDRIYRRSDSELVKRDIIIIMARWKSWHWLSDLRPTFRSLSYPERRALIIASYVLKDEGKHWRSAVKKELTPLENLVREWASDKAVLNNWQVPI